MKRENRRPTTPSPRRSRVANECIDAVLRGELNLARAIARKNAGRCDGLAAELRSLRESLDELRCLPESPDLTDRILSVVDREACAAQSKVWRMPIIGRFAIAAGLVIVTVVSGVFHSVEESPRQIAAVPQVAPVTEEAGKAMSLSLSASDIARYEQVLVPESLDFGGSGGALALYPIELRSPATVYLGPLSPTQAVLNVRSKSRRSTSSN